MKKSLLFLAFATFCIVTTTPATAALSWVGNGFAILNVNGAGDTWYDLDSVTGNADFDSDNSSANAYSYTITISQGQSIKLGGENQTYDQGSGTTSTLVYRVTSDFVSGSWNDLNLPWQQTTGNNDQWQAAGANMVEIGSSLAPGTHYLEIYQHAYRGTENAYHNEGVPEQSGNNWEARLVVVPEASTALLGLIGLLPLCRRRR